MSREREHRYLLTLNNLPINIITILLMIGLSFFMYWFIDYASIDLEVIKIDLVNRFGYNFVGFILYGLRYVLILFAFFVVYEFLKAIIMGVKKSSFICRIEKGDFYIKCCSNVYKVRIILSLLIPILLLGIIPLILSLYYKSFLLALIGVVTLLFNVRDIVLLIVLITIKNKVYKYTDYKKRNQFVLEIRKDFDLYKNIFIKTIKCIDEDEYVNENNVFVISRISLLLVFLLIIVTVLGVVL